MHLVASIHPSVRLCVFLSALCLKVKIKFLACSGRYQGLGFAECSKEQSHYQSRMFVCVSNNHTDAVDRLLLTVCCNPTMLKSHSNSDLPQSQNCFLGSLSRGIVQNCCTEWIKGCLSGKITLRKGTVNFPRGIFELHFSSISQVDSPSRCKSFTNHVQVCISNGCDRP